MSRIGRLPVEVPAGVKVEIAGTHVAIKGPKGEMARDFSPSIEIIQEGNQIIVKRSSDEATQRALHGTTRALINNMVLGVSAGFIRVLEIDGVGYRAEKTGSDLTLYLGFSHPVIFPQPAGISFDVDTKTRQIKVMGHDKEQVGQIAANIREIRPPEPYKGKGVHYLGEKIRRKAGKSGKTKK